MAFRTTPGLLGGTNNKGHEASSLQNARADDQSELSAKNQSVADILTPGGVTARHIAHFLPAILGS